MADERAERTEQRIGALTEGVRELFGRCEYLPHYHLQVFIGLEVLGLKRQLSTVLEEVTHMAETQQQQHDAIMASLNTLNTNLTTFNTTAVDLAAEVAELKAANPTVDFSDAETLATTLVTQSAAMVAAIPDPGPQASAPSGGSTASSSIAPSSSDAAPSAS